MELLHGVVQEYDWGSTTAIQDLLGIPATGGPAAELWFGAHPTAPARVGPAHTPLDEVIASDPVAALGSVAAGRFDGLPFMMKVLAAAAPLSLQAHPSTAQAAAGFAHEEAVGIPIDAAERMYRDHHHKPELICALSELRALCGFREPLATLAVIDTVATPALDPVRTMLGADPTAATLAALLEWLLSLRGDDATAVVEAVVEACRADGPAVAAAERAVVVELGDRHPGDPAVVVSLLLNHVVLSPGEALFLGAGNLHAYLGGTGVEVMASSDNVVRGGLTTKPVDVTALLDIVDCTPIIPEVQRPPTVDGVVHYDAPVPEFSLTRHVLDGPQDLPPGPAILLCTDGSVTVGALHIPRGAAAWIPASDPPARMVGTASVFRASIGDPSW